MIIRQNVQLVKRFKTKKKEGDKCTPRGIFKIKYILYRKDRVKRLYKVQT